MIPTDHAFLKGTELRRHVRDIRRLLDITPTSDDRVWREIMAADMHYLQACVFEEVKDEAQEESGQ